VAERAVYVDQCCELLPGASLLLYTDGLVERRHIPISESIARLEQVRGTHSDPDGFCDRVLEVMLAEEPELRDDMTLLALQAT
jgi:serine phosphatase RsbU (regulator of sigma subunit)